jgi:hypothetical protein
MLNVVMLNVIMLSVAALSVVAPLKRLTEPFYLNKTEFIHQTPNLTNSDITKYLTIQLGLSVTIRKLTD